MHEIWDTFKHGVEIFALVYFTLLMIGRYRAVKAMRKGDD
jgi:hypothetical protein